MVEIFPRRARKPDLKIYRSGKIDLSANVCKLLNIEEGDAVGCAYVRGSWWLYVRLYRAEIAGICRGRVRRINRGKTRTLRMWCKEVAAALLDAAGGGDMLAVPVGEASCVDGIGKAVEIILKLKLR